MHYSGWFATLDRNFMNLKNDDVIEQNQLWNFEVTTVMGFDYPTVCLLLDLATVNLPGYRNFALNMTIRANSFGGLFFEVTDEYGANYETTPEDGDDHFVSNTISQFSLTYILFVYNGQKI